MKLRKPRRLQGIGMACGVSLEVRAPFLDYNVVNYINSLPINLKMKGQATKYILKELFMFFPWTQFKLICRLVLKINLLNN